MKVQVSAISLCIFLTACSQTDMSGTAPQPQTASAKGSADAKPNLTGQSTSAAQQPQTQPAGDQPETRGKKDSKAEENVKDTPKAKGTATERTEDADDESDDENDDDDAAKAGGSSKDRKCIPSGEGFWGTPGTPGLTGTIKPGDDVKTIGVGGWGWAWADEYCDMTHTPRAE